MPNMIGEYFRAGFYVHIRGVVFAAKMSRYSKAYFIASYWLPDCYSGSCVISPKDIYPNQSNLDSTHVQVIEEEHSSRIYVVPIDSRLLKQRRAEALAISFFLFALLLWSYSCLDPCVRVLNMI